jgi:phosphoribosylformimino-5-aminoimidazole carboxamide ribotide isomerase
MGPEAVVFSLDLKDGRPLTTLSRWAACPPLEVAEAVVAAGFTRLIVLDLASVGIRQGPTVANLCQHLRRRHPEVELISGGGVRRLEDIQTLRAAGCDRVLVASALHDGSLTRDMLRPML